VCDEDELETGLKVVAIMQTITEEHDESSKKMLRKLLGISDVSLKKSDETLESND
jgi:hypothetical protein